MTFTDGQLLTAAQLNDLANKADLDSAVEAKIDEINGYNLSAAQSADTAASNSGIAQNAYTLAEQAAAEAETSAQQAAAVLASAIKGGNTFAAGATLNSLLDQINDGTNLYYWTGDYPKTVAAGSRPDDDGFGINYWAVAGDAVLRSGLIASDGYKHLGQVASYATLKLMVPSYAGQSILLKSYNDSWSGLNKPPQGGGEFVAVNAAGSDDGGSIAVVNSSWYWQRVIPDFYTPEMFGAAGDGSKDDAAAINSAIAAAFTAKVDVVRGSGIYLVKSQVTLLSGYHASPFSAGAPRQGFSLYLNVVIVDNTAWPAVPAQWWNATAVFVPPPGVDVENFKLHINQMDCGGVATAISSDGGALNTSDFHIADLRNHIIGYKNYLSMFSQSSMNKITGRLWQDGYIGVLNGGLGNGTGNSECHEVDINWCANHRYGGVSLQDRSQYAYVRGGTFDYNGKWACVITLTNYTSTDPFVIEFGDAISNGTVTGYALSSIMNNNGSYVLMLTETADKNDGVSDYKVGDTLTFGNWSAKISEIQLTSAVNPYYFDIIICNRSGDFSKCTITPTYLGGFKGHNLFTNVITCPNSVATTSAVNYRGLGITGGVPSSYWYLEHLYGTNPFFEFYSTNMVIDTGIVIRSNPFYGSKGSYNAVSGTPVTIMTFSPADNELYPDYYTLLIGTSIQGQFAKILLRVGQTAIRVEDSTLAYFTIDVSGFNLTATINGSDAIITVTSRREM